MPNPKHPPAGLSRDDAARYVGVSPALFDQLVRDGILPRSLPLKRRRRIWLVDALQERLRTLAGLISSQQPVVPEPIADTTDPWLSRIRGGGNTPSGTPR